MTHYIAFFNGRLKGAIGIFHTCRVEVSAETPEEARLKLYETHDHITALTLHPVDEEKPETPFIRGPR